MLAKSALQVRGQKTILNVNAGGQSLFCDFAQDKRLIGSLLSVLRKDHDPSGV